MVVGMGGQDFTSLLSLLGGHAFRTIVTHRTQSLHRVVPTEHVQRFQSNHELQFSGP
jgi:hypothetical protein